MGWAGLSANTVRKISHWMGSVSWNSSTMASLKRARSVAVSSPPRGPRKASRTSASMSSKSYRPAARLRAATRSAMRGKNSAATAVSSETAASASATTGPRACAPAARFSVR